MNPAVVLKNQVRLLALDLDDTLLGSNLKISPENRRAIQSAEDNGVQVVLASGRSPEALYPYARELGMDKREGYLIAFNGSLILRSDTGEEKWGVKLNTKLVGELWDLATRLGAAIQTYLPNEIIYNKPNKYTDLDHQITHMPIRLVNREEFAAADRVKINVPGEPDFLSTIEGEFLSTFAGQANMYRTKPFFFEVMPPAADKGFALERLAALLGIERADVMAMGDAMNDEGMLRWAGISVAMANALPAIRSLCSWVTSKTHDENGVAEAIDRFIGNER